MKVGKNYRWKIQFDEINGVSFVHITEKKHIISGGIKNPYYPLKLGIAYIGNVNSKEHEKEFNKWRAMIERCYDKNNNHYNTYGARGVKVSDRWLCFEYFLNDIELLEGYDEEKMKSGDLHLDKDIKGDSMIYSLENCLLVSPTENVEEMLKRTKKRKVKAESIIDGSIIYADSQHELAIILGSHQSNINKCIKGKRNTAKNYKISEVEEND